MSSREMVTKLKHIILGTYYNLFKKHNDIAYPRLKICSRCNSNKISFGFGNYCGECGCLLESKTRVQNEKCPLNKW